MIHTAPHRYLTVRTFARRLGHTMRRIPAHRPGCPTPPKIGSSQGVRQILRFRYCFLILLGFVGGCDAQEAEISYPEPRCSDYRKTPVFLVHGSGLDSTTFTPLIDAFRDAGYPRESILAIDLKPNDGDNIHAAETFIADGVRKQLAAVNEATARLDCAMPEHTQVNIVAHSMGAFSSRWFLRYVRPEAVRSLVTLAGSNRGTDRLCGRRGRGNEQMCPANDPTPDSAQGRLNGVPEQRLDETPWGSGPDPDDITSMPATVNRRIAYVAIRLEPDAWIEPATSAELAGAGGFDVSDAARYELHETSPGNYLFTGAASHDGLPTHPAIAAFLLDGFAAEARDKAQPPGRPQTRD